MYTIAQALIVRSLISNKEVNFFNLWEYISEKYTEFDSTEREHLCHLYIRVLTDIQDNVNNVNIKSI